MSSFCFSSTSGGLSIVLKIDPSKSMFGIDLIYLDSSKFEGVRKVKNFPKGTIPAASAETAQNSKWIFSFENAEWLKINNKNSVMLLFFSWMLRTQPRAHCTQMYRI